jgi:osmotically-inducible protein OsmY
MAGIAGVVALSAAAVGAGYVLRDRERREQARQRIYRMQSAAARQMQSTARQMQSAARQRYAELTGGRMRVEADLRRRVEQAIAATGSPPAGLEVMVEGRTVYLRGAVADTALVDAAAERVHGVPGVVAVVNLTSSGTDQQRMRASTQP